jgi:hypothetical protein
MSDTFSDPGTGGGDQLPLAELKGSLLLVTVIKETDEIETKFGPNTAIQANVAVLDGSLKGETFDDVLIFPRVLKGQLRGSIGGKVLGRLGQGENKKGNPPWQLAAATNDEKETGTKYLAHIATAAPEAEEPF